MILYHIHTNPKLEYTPGEVITIGSVENKLRQHNLDVTPSFIYDEVKQFADNMHMKQDNAKCPALGSESFNIGKAMGSELSLNKQFGLKAIGH